mmetsp:Transcript_109816/g.261841  ORF Transcript_109816/g.261841 Transcript_109816/m.261841 type:complete len:119 (-) Transcript_109816:67-423(-)|eukprot:CAMPEP_0181453368 /NCGR_PEP_ID=MMETSP1110-20121109/29689_1 /TAXON_ID=174948 /ORGANISM="Symbiodinium sp., Strain CCMP421" /LENGTH=118 /DNA_ID=CAMNT_0023577685 /DNA_START=71 /DNA_END=427 /DNA_ORIENTATION=+
MSSAPAYMPPDPKMTPHRLKMAEGAARRRARRQAAAPPLGMLALGGPGERQMKARMRAAAANSKSEDAGSFETASKVVAMWHRGAWNDTGCDFSNQEVERSRCSSSEDGKSTEEQGDF